MEYDGECPKFKEMTTDTARLGAQTNIQIDVISDSFAVECKARDSIPQWLEEPWEQIIERAEDNDKHPLLAIKANYTEPMYCIPESVLKELLDSN